MILGKNDNYFLERGEEGDDRGRSWVGNRAGRGYGGWVV